MSKNYQSLSEPICELEAIPKHIHGVFFDDQERRNLQMGNPSSVKKFEMPDGSHKKGKIQYYQYEGELKEAFYEQHEKLNIPKKIGRKNLSPDQYNELASGREIAVSLSKHSQVFVKVDQDLRRIQIRTNRSRGIPKEIGGYNLSFEDEINLAKGRDIGTKVMYSPEQKSYFMANIGFDKDQLGLEFENPVMLSHKQAQSLMVTYNQSREKVIKSTFEKSINQFQQQGREINLGYIREITKKGYQPTYGEMEKYIKNLEEGPKKQAYEAANLDYAQSQKINQIQPGDSIYLRNGKSLTVEAINKDRNTITGLDKEKRKVVEDLDMINPLKESPKNLENAKNKDISHQQNEMK